MNHRAARLALDLHDLATDLESFEIDNGPNGSCRPFYNKARLIRQAAAELGRNATGSSSVPIDDFRDVPWEPR